MLDFTDILVEDREQMQRLLATDGARMNERVFAVLYCWSSRDETSRCLKDDMLYIKAKLWEGRRVYFAPCGTGDIAAAMDNIARDAAEHGERFRVIAVSDAQKAAIEAARPGVYEFTPDRDNFDYIYNAEDLISLAGKKYHSKRNFINRFLNKYGGDWRYEPVDPLRHTEEILAFQKEWCRKRLLDGGEVDCLEYCAIKRALEAYDALELRGGLLRVGGAVAAFTFGSAQDEQTIDILVEKADHAIDGAYQMINHEFAKVECADFTFINREEDMGIEGLRRAKLSYYPVELTQKYFAQPKGGPA